VVFSKPLIGPSGARLISYEWRWKPEEYIDNRGEDKVRKVSDWGQAEQSVDTGRDIVHQFMVEMPNGNSKLMSAESVLSVLGYTEKSQGKRFPSVVNAVKTLAKLQMQLAIREAEKQALEISTEEIKKQGFPDIEITEWKEGEFGAHVILKMGDAFVFDNAEKGLTRDKYDPPKERVETLQDGYIEAELKKRGLNSKLMLVEGFISNLKERIEKQQKKIDSAVEKQQAETPKQKTKKQPKEEPRPPESESFSPEKQKFIDDAIIPIVAAKNTKPGEMFTKPTQAQIDAFKRTERF
jgi:hypothetical protein